MSCGKLRISPFTTPFSIFRFSIWVLHVGSSLFQFFDCSIRFHSLAFYYMIFKLADHFWADPFIWVRFFMDFQFLLVWKFLKAIHAQILLWFLQIIWILREFSDVITNCNYLEILFLCMQVWGRCTFTFKTRQGKLLCNFLFPQISPLFL